MHIAASTMITFMINSHHSYQELIINYKLLPLYM